MSNLIKELSTISRDMRVLLIIPRELHEDIHMGLLGHFLETHQGSKGAYVTLNRPYKAILSAMKKRNLDSSRVFFIDCVTGTKERADNCVFLRTPESLTQIGISLDPIFKNSDFSFVMLDSLDALSIYHNSNMVIRFARNIIERSVEHKHSGIMIGVREDMDRRIIDELEAVCDKVIDLTK
ncbi:MAG TPA: hypothetical protein VJH88_03050 [Candidatus Nanoarchaeia archaeon]|nr:hypothetical protein [Candidatus Nanoarchaeia archaeon]